MPRVRITCALLLALTLLLPGGNLVLDLFEVPQPDGSTSGGQLLQMLREGGLMWWIALGHVLVGLLLLWPRTRFAAGLVQFPITLGIFAFNTLMFPPGVWLATGMLLLNLGMLLDPARIQRLLQAPAA